MSQNSLFLRLDIVIGVDNIYLDTVKINKELKIRNPNIFACINNTPTYKIKITRKEGFNIAKILKIFDLREMEKLKEKYCFEV